MFQPEFNKLDENARFSPIVKFPIFHSGRQRPAKSSRKQQIMKNTSGVCYFLALTKTSELAACRGDRFGAIFPEHQSWGEEEGHQVIIFLWERKKIHSQLYFPASWGVSHFSIPINEPSDLLKWMAHSTFSGNCESFKRYEMLMGCPWRYLQETTFFH